MLMIASREKDMIKLDQIYFSEASFKDKINTTLTRVFKIGEQKLSDADEKGSAVPRDSSVPQEFLNACTINKHSLL